MPSGIGLACFAGVALLGCVVVVLLRDPTQPGLGISQARAQAIYGFAGVLAAVAAGLWVFNALRLTADHFDVEENWPVVIGGVLCAGAIFAASCFVGALTTVLYQAGVEAPRARRAEQSLADEQRRRSAEFSERRSVEERQTRASTVKRERRIFDLELIYNFNERQVADRFSKAEFERFVGKYLRPDVNDDEFFDRAKQLQATIERHAEEAGGPEHKLSLEEAAGWYRKRKADLEGLPVDEYYKEDLQIQLNERYAELCQQLMAEIGPT